MKDKKKKEEEEAARKKAEEEKKKRDFEERKARIIEEKKKQDEAELEKAKNLGLMDYVREFAWVINIWLIGVPWLIFSTLCVGWNLYLNIFSNHWWAQGNVFLIGMTVYMMIQYIMSIPLLFEWEEYLKTWKILRLNSATSAVWFVLFYAFFVFEFFNIAN